MDQERAQCNGIGNCSSLLIAHTTSYQGAFEQAASERLKGGTEILSMAIECSPDARVRLAVGMAGCALAVLEYNPRTKALLPVFIKDLAATIPRCVSYTKTPSRDMYVLGMYDGKMCVILEHVPCSHSDNASGTRMIIRHDGSEIINEKKVAPIMWVPLSTSKFKHH